MKRYKSIIGALVLCALSICAFAAASASAEGLTAVECKEVGTGNGNYNSNHCTTPKNVGGKYDTRVITGALEVEGKDTRVINKETGEHGLGSTENPVAVFHAQSLGGLEITVTCGKGNITGGTIENIAGPPEMRIHTTGAVATWSECHAAPRTKPTRTCAVQSHEPEEPVGSIKTNKLTATTGENHKVTIEAEEVGKPITKFEIIGGSTAGACIFALGTNVTITVTGKAVARADTTTHSHLTFDEVSNKEGTLEINGFPATQTETVTGFKKGNEEATIGAETLG
jgi:hypothetical protein